MVFLLNEILSQQFAHMTGGWKKHFIFVWFANVNLLLSLFKQLYVFRWLDGVIDAIPDRFYKLFKASILLRLEWVKVQARWDLYGDNEMKAKANLTLYIYSRHPVLFTHMSEMVPVFCLQLLSEATRSWRQRPEKNMSGGKR